LATLQERIVGALRLETRTFEEVEADQTATSQALAVVVLAGASTAIGVAGLRPGLLVTTLIAAIVGWLLWSLLTFLIGAKLLPERDTNVDIGQMLRVLGFAAAPGLFGILGIIPFLGGIVRVVIWIWQLIATVIAVRQALDYTSTARAVLVCLIGWAVNLIVFMFLTGLFAGAAMMGRPF
jgi:Yip1 domain